MECCVFRMQEESKRRGELIEQQVVILDLKGLSMAPNSTGVSVFKETIRIDQVGCHGD
jgi:dihydropteroate synthase